MLSFTKCYNIYLHLISLPIYLTLSSRCFGAWLNLLYATLLAPVSPYFAGWNPKRFWPINKLVDKSKQVWLPALHVVSNREQHPWLLEMFSKEPIYVPVALNPLVNDDSVSPKKQVGGIPPFQPNPSEFSHHSNDTGSFEALLPPVNVGPCQVDLRFFLGGCRSLVALKCFSLELVYNYATCWVCGRLVDISYIELTCEGYNPMNITWGTPSHSYFPHYLSHLLMIIDSNCISLIVTKNMFLPFTNHLSTIYHPRSNHFPTPNKKNNAPFRCQLPRWLCQTLVKATIRGLWAHDLRWFYGAFMVLLWWFNYG